MLTLMVVCTAAAILVVGFWAFSEFRHLWTHPDHRATGGGSRVEHPHSK